MPHPALKALKIAALSLLGLCTVFLLGTRGCIEYSLRAKSFEAESIANLKKSYGSLLTNPALFAPGNNKDAGAVLNRLNFVKVDKLAIAAANRTATTLDTSHWQAPELRWWDLQSNQDLIKLNKAWQKDPSSLPELDDSLLNELLEYDHWNPNSSGPYAHLLMPNVELPFLFVPKAELDGLKQLAKVRLSRSIRENDVLTALNEVRHLSRICQSLEFLVGPATAIELLQIEAEAYDAALTMGILRADQWSIVDEKTRALAEYLIRNSAALLSPLRPTLLTELFSQEGPSFASCALLNEVGKNIVIVDQMMSDPGILELDLSESMMLFEKLLNSSRCRMDFYRKTNGKEYNTYSLDPPFTASIPYLRQLKWVNIYGQTVREDIRSTTPPAI